MRGQEGRLLGNAKRRQKINKSLKLNAIITKEVTRNAFRDKSDVRQPPTTPHVIQGRPSFLVPGASARSLV